MREPTWHLPVASALIMAAVLAAYWPVLGHDFIGIDDEVMVSKNPDLNPPSPAKIARYWTTSARALYMPLTYTVWGATAALSGISPKAFHVLNLALHALAALATFALLRKLIAWTWPAAIGVLLFALHPVQVESVAWISETKDLLAGVLTIVGLWLYVHFAASPDEPNDRLTKSAYYLLAMAAFVLAMLAKPSAVAAPLAAGAIDVLLLRRPPRRVITAIAPALAIAALFTIVTMRVQQGDFAGVTGEGHHIGLLARPFVAGDALSFYLFKLLAPLKLGMDYGRSPWWLMRHSWVWLTAAIPVVIGIWLWRSRERLAELTVAAALFAIGVLPVLGLATFDFQEKSTVADHYLYLSMLGPALAVAWCVAKWPRPGVFVAAAVILIALGVRTHLQTHHWRDSLAVYRNGIAVNPDSWWMRGALAFEHEKAGRFDEALAEWERCVAIAPYYADAHAHLGAVLLTKGRTAEAIAHLKTSLEINPQDAEAQTLLEEARQNLRFP